MLALVDVECWWFDLPRCAGGWLLLLCATDNIEGTCVSLLDVCELLGRHARGVVLVTLDCCRHGDVDGGSGRLVVPCSM